LASSWDSLWFARGPHAALVKLEGPIGAQATASAEHAIAALRSAFDNGNVKAVMLDIDSPGEGLTDRQPIHAVIGGTHLLRADADRLAFTAQALERFGVAYLAPIHCTGLPAVCYFRDRFHSQFRESPVGTRHQFG